MQDLPLSVEITLTVLFVVGLILSIGKIVYLKNQIQKSQKIK